MAASNTPFQHEPRHLHSTVVHMCQHLPPVACCTVTSSVDQQEAFKDVDNVVPKVNAEELSGVGKGTNTPSVPTTGRGYWPMVEMLRRYWLPGDDSCTHHRWRLAMLKSRSLFT
jgi:hypothetical protein